MLNFELRKIAFKLKTAKAAGSGQPEFDSGFRPLITHNS
jgi:hypothetical protein